ncbi:hypothetical protein RSAG8_13261, partial [Rhizoctonia solani AG-8 WAC10335]
MWKMQYHFRGSASVYGAHQCLDLSRSFNTSTNKVPVLELRQMVTTTHYQPTLQAQDPLQRHSFVELVFEMPSSSYGSACWYNIVISKVSMVLSQIGALTVLCDWLYNVYPIST